jgi:excisionase family DNA binding protein
MRAIAGMDDELLSAEATAALLGVGLVTIHRWCRSGRLRCAKPGKAWRVRRADLAAFVQGTAPPQTLVEHLADFLTVPDQLLALVADPSQLRRLDAAILRVGAARGGRLAKFYDPAAGSRHALTTAYQAQGLDVAALAATGQLRWCPVGEPATAVRALEDLLAEAAGQPVWALFDGERLAAIEDALRQQGALAALAAVHPLVAVMAVVEPEPAQWPSLAEQWALLGLLRGTLRLSQAGLVLSRVAQPREDDGGGRTAAQHAGVARRFRCAGPAATRAPVGQHTAPR